MTGIPLPFEEDWPLEKMMTALKTYFCVLSERVVGDSETTNALIRHLIDSRYAPVYGRSQCDSKCDGIDQKWSKELKTSFSEHPYFIQLTSLFESISKEKTGVRELTLLAFIETASFYSVTENFVNDFIQCCLWMCPS